jgi:hypothetical protein
MERSEQVLQSVEMALKIVIENTVLHGLADDNACQRVATAYINGERYTVVAPARLTGEALEYVDHFSVREPSKEALDWGAEFVVTDERKGLILQAVAEELHKRKRDANRAEGRTPDGIYHDAQICIRGHVQSAGGFPFKAGEHCTKCGSPCIDECVKCREPIRGQVVNSKFIGYTPPSFCHACGHPYPWMEDRLQTAKELLYHDDKLNEDDREKLWDLLQYVMSNPKSDLVPAKKKLIEFNLGKAAVATKDLVMEFLVKYVAEMSKP